MKTKKLFNTSEYKAVFELRETLEGKGFYVHPEMQVKNVIQIEGNDIISKKDKKTLNTASFDFVVYNNESIPEFIIEFDGPHHSLYSKKRESDIRKNRLCSLARLPLLRIDDSFLTKYEEISFLRFIVGRFVAWRRDFNAITQEIEKRLPHKPSYAEADDYDPWNDPTIIFDMKYPFPASVEVAERLFNNYGVVTNYLNDELYYNATSKYPYTEFSRDKMGGGPIGEFVRRIERSYLLEKIFKDSAGKYNQAMLHNLVIKVDYKWGLPTFSRIDINNAGEIPSILFQGIPGTSMSELADHFCDFLALKKIEEWAQDNLLHA